MVAGDAAKEGRRMIPISSATEIGTYSKTEVARKLHLRLRAQTELQQNS